MKQQNISRSIFILLSILSFLIFSHPAYPGKMTYTNTPPLAYENPKAVFLSGQVIVKFKDGRGVSSLRQPSTFDIQESQRISFGFTQLFISGDVLKACEELMKDPSIEVAEPNYIRYLQSTPNDPLFFKQDNMKLSRADLGWNIETGDAEVVVAVIDTGIDKIHPDLYQNIITGQNLLNPEKDESDDSGHGTAVSGVIGAIGNNSVGVAGAAWNIRLLPLKACGGPSLTCPVSAEVEAIETAIIEGADIINLSYGGFSPLIFEETAINEAWAAGIVIFAAAGNGGDLGKFGNPETESNIYYPAGYEHVCGVASVDYPTNGDLSKIVRSDFSNSGDAVSVTAVGSSVVTTAPTVPVDYLIFTEQADYGRIDGTSFSTPLVSGLAALIKSHFPNLTNAEIRNKIESSTWDLGPTGWDNDFGWGLVDFQKALTGSTHSSNQAFNVGITASPIFMDDIIIIVKVKMPIAGNPKLSYMYLENGALKSGAIGTIKLPDQNNIWAARFNTQYAGSITFKVNGIASGGGNLPELVLDYARGKSN